MKMKNIAFFGVMASILSVAGAYAETSTPTTIIATKAYVDNQVGDLDSTITADTGKVLKGVTITNGKLTAKSETTLATVATSGSYEDLSNKPTIPTSSNFVTNGTNALDLSASTTKAPSVTAVQGMKTTSLRTKTTGTGDDVAVDTKVPTEKAVATALAGKQDTISDLATIRSNASAGAGAASTIAGYGNIVTHSTSEFATSTQGGKADTAVQTIKKNGTAVTKTDGVVDITVPTKTSEITNDSGFITSAALPTSSNFVSNGSNALDLSASTTKAPSVTAVQGMKTTSLRTKTTGTGDDVAVDTKVPTEKAVATALAGKQDTISDLATIRSGAAAGATALQSSNVVSTYSATGTAPINGTGVAAAIGGLNSTKNATTNQVITGITQTDGKIASVTSTLITNNNIAAAGTANIEYAKMKAPSATINGGTAACSASAPCVLSYDGSSYSWTTFAY